MLTGGGGALLAFKLKRDSGGWARDYLLTSAAVVVFSASLVAGVQWAFHVDRVALHEQHEQRVRDMVDLDNARVLWRHHVVEDLDFRTKMIEQCSKNEALVNAGRSALGLPTLSTEAFCDTDELKSPNIFRSPAPSASGTPG